MAYSNKELNAADEAVEKLVEVTKLTEREIIDVLENGFAMKYKGKLPSDIVELIDELRASFDVY